MSLSRPWLPSAAASLILAAAAFTSPWGAVADAQAVKAAPLAAPDFKISDELWKQARAGDLTKFDKTLSQLAAAAKGENPNPVASAAATLQDHFAQREEARAKRLAETRTEFEKALAGEQSDVGLAKALRSATELQVLSIDKDAVMQEAPIVKLIADSTAAAHSAEERGDVFGAYELFYLLGTLQEEAGTFKPDVRRLSQRLEMLRQYVPETLWKLRNDRQKATGEKELPPYNPFGDDYQTKLSSIDQTMVMRALARTTQHVEQQSLNVTLTGGLESVKVLVTTKALEGAFPKLGTPVARDAMVAAIDNEIRQIAAATRPYDLTQAEGVIDRIEKANQATTKVPAYVIYHEFGIGAMSKLDEFSAIIWPDELRRFNKMTQSNFVGVGVQIEYDETSNVRVVTPIEGTPAQRAGIHSGDVLKKVDGRNIFGLSLDQAVDVITGAQGTDVVLTMQRKIEGEKNEKGEAKTEDIDFRLTRAVIKVPSIKGWTRSGVKEDDWNWFIDKESGIGYVRLSQFVDNSGKEFDEAMRAMRKQGLSALIFDLRFNPGGLLDQAVRIGRRFVDSPTGFIVAMRGPDGQISSPEETMPDRATLANIPIIVLINEGSASASEIVSGALHCFEKSGPLDGHLDAIILGARSYGKGSVQNVWPLTQNSAIKVTTAYYVIPDKTILHRRPGSTTWGVEPNLKIEMLPKQTVDSLLLRRNADIMPMDENGKVIDDPAHPRPQPEDLIAKGLDLQLETALVLLKSRLAAGTPTQAAADHAKQAVVK